MIKKIILFSLIFTTILSCSNDVGDGDRVLINNKLVEYTAFTHNSGHLIRMWADSNNIYVSNAPDFKIFAYDFKGKIKETFGKKGRGPGEFGSIWFFQKEKYNKSKTLSKDNRGY